MKKRTLIVILLILIAFAMSSCSIMNDPYFRAGWDMTCPDGWEFGY